MNKESGFLSAILGSQLMSNAGMRLATVGKAGRGLGAQIVRHQRGAKGSKPVSTALSSVAGLVPDFEMALSSGGKAIRDKSRAMDVTSRYYKHFQGMSDKQLIDAAKNAANSPRQMKFMLQRLEKVDNPVLQKALRANKPLTKQLTSENPEHRAEAVKVLLKIKNRYSILKNVAPGALKELNVMRQTPEAIEAARKTRWFQKPVAAAGMAGSAVLQNLHGVTPAGAVGVGMNAAKRFMSSETVSKIPKVGPLLQKAQGKLSDVLVKNRTGVLFNEGLGNAGKGFGPELARATTGVLRPVTRKIDSLFNDATVSQIKNISFDLGKANKNAKLLGYGGPNLRKTPVAAPNDIVAVPRPQA